MRKCKHCCDLKVKGLFKLSINKKKYQRKVQIQVSKKLIQFKKHKINAKSVVFKYGIIFDFKDPFQFEITGMFAPHHIRIIM